MTKKKLMEKVYYLIRKEVDKEREKYMCGLKNNYYELEEFANDYLIKDSLLTDYKIENKHLKQQLRDLQDKYYGRG